MCYIREPHNIFTDALANEELGITDFTPERLTSYVFESEREKELVFVHKTWVRSHLYHHG